MQRRRFLIPLAVVALVLTGLAAAAFRPDGRDEKAGAGGSDAKKAARAAEWEAFLQEYDQDKDGQLTKEEVPGWLHHNFARIDANKDGKLSKGELEKGMLYLNQRRRPSDVIAVLVEMSDCDECCAEELQLVYETLRTIDRNSDGKIDADELKNGRATIIKKRVDGLFKELDRDKDGKIAKSEARGQVRAHFAELDADKDGFVSRDELAAGASAKPDKADDKTDPRRDK